MKTILCIFLIFLTSLGKSYAQTLFQGTVSNLQSKPLPYATVNFLASDKSTVIFSSVTDSSGIFKIAINEDTLLKNSRYVFATYLKAKSDTLLIENVQSQLNIVVNDSISVLSNVVVESKIPTMLRKADRFVFTPNQQITQGSSSLDLLRIIPLIQYDEKSNFFSIINRASTVVYINNRKSNMPKDMIISILRSTPAENIKNVEIITNPGSEYSANTTGGVININLKRMYYEGWSGNLTLSNQQSVYNTAILNGSVNYRKNKVGLRISPFVNNSFNYSKTEFVIDPNSFQSQSNGIISHRKYLVLGGGIGLDYDITSNDLLSFNGFISSVNGQTKQSNTTIYSSGIPMLIDSIYDSPVRGNDTYLYNFGNIYYQHSFDSSEKKILTLTVDYNQYQQKNKNVGEFNKLPITENNNYKYQNVLPQHFLNFSARADYTWQINDKNKLSSGYQESATNVNNDLSYYSISENNQYQLNPNLSHNYKYHENYHAFYVSLVKTLSTKFNSSLGLRFERTNYFTEVVNATERNDSNYNNLFPNLSFDYAIDKQNDISFSFSKRIKRPNIEILFPGRTYYNINSFQENNPFLQPVLSYNAESMYALKGIYYFTLGYSFAKNQYAQFVLPAVEDNSEKQKTTYLNYGSYSNAYFSFYNQQKIFKNFWESYISINLNYYFYDFSKSRSTILGEDVKNLNYDFQSTNTFHLSNKKSILAFLWLKYYSPVKDVAYKRENILFSTDLGFRKSWKKVSLSLYLTDLFNTYRYTILNYRPNPAFVYNHSKENDYTRAISIDLRYSFGNQRLKSNSYKKTANEDIKNRIN